MTSDLEAVKQAHRTETERWTQRNFLLHSQLEQVSCELSQSQAGVREQGLEVKRLRERLSQAEAGMQQALEKVSRSVCVVSVCVCCDCVCVCCRPHKPPGHIIINNRALFLQSKSACVCVWCVCACVW